MNAAHDILHSDHRPAAWIAERGQSALAQLREHGLPHRRLEDWKYSDLREALAAEAVAVASEPAPDPFAGLGYARLSFEDGRLTAGLEQLPAGLDAVDLNGAAPIPEWARSQLGRLAQDGLSGAALALMAGGLAVRVPSGLILEEPIAFAFRSVRSHHARVLLVLEEGAALSLVEHHAHRSRLANLGVEIVLEPRARLHHVRLAQNSGETALVQTMGMRQAAGSHYHAHYADLGARLSRLELHLALEGVGTQTELTGVQVLEAGRHSDVTTRLTHSQGGNASGQLFKQVVGARARAAYQGRITVSPGADGTDSRQVAKALLLDASAEADLKPELIIFADDVQCAHGAAVGDLDPDSLFYLRSRGLSEREARSLLLRAFLEDAVFAIADGPLKNAIWGVIEQALAVAGGV